MSWNRQTRGLFQRKQEKPQIKKHKPLDSEGNDGDITIRQLNDGVFLFFKALGKWYKTLNTASQAIPEPSAPSSFSLGAPNQPIESMVISENSLHIGNAKSTMAKISLSSDKTDLVFKNSAGTERKVVGKKASSTAGDTNAENTITLGDESGSATFGQMYLGAGNSHYGGFLTGCSNITSLVESDYLGVRVLAQSGKGLSIVPTAGVTQPCVYLAAHDTGGGHIALREVDDDPAAVDNYGILYVDLYDHFLYYRHNELNSGKRVILGTDAGTILGYTAIGIDATTASYNVTDAFVTINSGAKVTFVAPASGNVEIFASVFSDASAGRQLYLGLSDNATYNAVDVTHEHEVWQGHSTNTEELQINHTWAITGLTAGTSYTYWIGAKASHSSIFVLRWGGDATAEHQPFIIKATSLPVTIYDGS